jgi:hypothetical protein
MSRQLTWLAQVLSADPDHYKKDCAYKFSNGRRFESADANRTWAYDDDLPTGGSYIVDESGNAIVWE